MKTEIVKKLAEHLSKPVDTECAAVYLMAELRKLLDIDDPNHTKRALWMYCHWALHVDLTSRGTTIDFLRRVDLWINNNVAYLTPSGPFTFSDETSLFHDFVYLQTLRTEMKDFLTGYGLPPDVCTINDQWFGFLGAYARVIEDGSLSISTDKTSPLVAVESVTFQRGKALSSEYHVNFVIRWDIELKDGRTVRVDMDAQPNDKVTLTSHHIKVINNKFIPPYEIDGNGNKIYRAV